MVLREAGRVTVRLFAPPCTDCDTQIASASPATVPGWACPDLRMLVRVTSASCPAHTLSFRLSRSDGSAVLVMRTPTTLAGWRQDAWYRLVGHANLPSLDEEAVVAISTVLDVVADLPGWGVDEAADPESVEQAVGEAVAWAAAGHDAATARAWQDAGVTSAGAARKWVDGGFSVEAVASFARMGVTRLDAAEVWRDMWWSPAQAPREFANIPAAWAFLLEEEALPRTIEWGALHAVATPRFARIGHAHGQSPDAVRVLACSLHNSAPPRTGNLMRQRFGRGAHMWEAIWPGDVAEQIETFATSLGPADWALVGLCLDAGMDWAAAARHVLNGEDMTPVRVMAGLLH